MADLIMKKDRDFVYPVKKADILDANRQRIDTVSSPEDVHDIISRHQDGPYYLLPIEVDFAAWRRVQDGDLMCGKIDQDTEETED